MPAEQLTDFGALLEPALEQGRITPTQAWEVLWAWNHALDGLMTPQLHNLMREVLIAAGMPSQPQALMH